MDAATIAIKEWVKAKELMAQPCQKCDNNVMEAKCDCPEKLHKLMAAENRLVRIGNAP